MPITIENVAVDSADAARLAAFWSQVLQQPVDDGGNEFFASIGRDSGAIHPTLMFLKVPEERAGKNRVHLDLATSDYPEEIGRLEQLGATRVREFVEYGITWTTFLDPEGNVFDLARSDGA
jgi:predicted enzyme related to lactoylglutathione lyase